MAHPAQVRRLGRFFLQPPGQKDWRGFEGCTKSTRERSPHLRGGGVRESTPSCGNTIPDPVLFNKYPPGDVPIRTMRELRTVAAVIDYVVNNDPLRALDVLVQRFKALELSHEQQSWAQASQLELILSDQTSAVFRQEVKAAQAEVKSNWQLEAGPQRPQRWHPQQPWSGAAQAGTSVQKEGSPAQSDDKPPLNTSPQKGKGKGKKGKNRRRW